MSCFPSLNMKLSHFIISIFTVIWTEGVYSVNDKLVSQRPKEQLSKPNSKVSLTFSHKIPSYDTILWYRCSPGDTALILIAYMYYKDPTVEQPFVDRFNVSGDGQKEALLHLLDLRPEDRGVYFGAAWGRRSDVAYFGGGTKLSVLETGREPIPPTVKLFKPSAKERDRTNKKTLVCLASNFYPDHVSVIWSINGNRHEGSTDSAAQRVGSFYRITSRLTVNAEQWHNPDNSFKCEVNFFDGKVTSTHQKTLKGVKGNTTVFMKRENLLRITQNAKLSYIIFITKSCVYGAFVTFLVWKFHASAGKQK